MTTFDYRIAADIFRSHPGYCRGVVVLDIASNEPGPLTSTLTQQLHDRIGQRVGGGRRRCIGRGQHPVGGQHQACGSHDGAQAGRGAGK